MNADVIFSWIIIIAPILVVLGIISWFSYRAEEVDRYTRRNLGGRATIPKTRKIIEELIADALVNPHQETKSRSSRSKRSSKTSEVLHRRRIKLMALT